MLARTLDGEITITRTKDTVTATATQNKIAGGWDFVAMDDWGRIISADSVPNYSAVLAAFKVIGL
jgi:hypothetical protein